MNESDNDHIHVVQLKLEIKSLKAMVDELSRGKKLILTCLADKKKVEERVVELEEWKNSANRLLVDIHTVAVADSIRFSSDAMLEVAVDTVIDWKLSAEQIPEEDGDV